MFKIYDIFYNLNLLFSGPSNCKKTNFTSVCWGFLYHLADDHVNKTQLHELQWIVKMSCQQGILSLEVIRPELNLLA